MREQQLQQSINNLEAKAVSMLELTENVVLLSKYAADWFVEGNRDDKRLIVQSLCSNSVLSSGKLSVQAKNPFKRIGTVEKIPYLLAVVDAIRTVAQDRVTAENLINVTQCLKARAEARLSQKPVPSLSHLLPISRSAPKEG